MMKTNHTHTHTYKFILGRDLAKMLEVLGVDRVIAVDLQRPGHQSEGTFFNVPVETCITEGLGINYFAKEHPALFSEGKKVVVVAPNPDTVKKAQIFRYVYVYTHTHTHTLRKMCVCVCCVRFSSLSPAQTAFTLLMPPFMYPLSLSPHTHSHSYTYTHTHIYTHTHTQTRPHRCLAGLTAGVFCHVLPRPCSGWVKITP